MHIDPTDNMVNGYSGGMSWSGGMEFITGKFYKTIGLDSWGLWTKGPFSEKDGKYKGEACSQKGDTLEGLAKLITGDSKDAKLIKQNFRKGKPRQRIKVAPLIEKLEETLRHNVAEATKSFNANFGGFPIGKKPDGGSDFIDDFFQENPLQVPSCECRTAAVLVLAKGLINTIGSESFNKLFTIRDLTSPSLRSNRRLIKGTRGVALKDVKKGDWGYIKGYANYVASAENAWGGENVIYVGNDEFWGHDLGTDTYEGIVKKLKELGEVVDGPNGKFIGWLNYTEFFKMSYLAQRLFDHRNK